MEIVAGEVACYRILAYISLKMEMHWRSSPVGKVRKNLPFFKELAYEYFTQKKLDTAQIFNMLWIVKSLISREVGQTTGKEDRANG